MTVISYIYFDVAMILSKWERHQIIKLLKLARVDVGTVSKTGENMEGIIN